MNVAGVSVNFEDDVFEMRIIFFNDPSDEEKESFEDIEAEFISSHDKGSKLSFYSFKCCDLSDCKGNLGWIFLRKEAVEIKLKGTLTGN